MINRDNITEILLSKNIKPSYQRIKVLEYLIEKRSHPTVDEIYGALVKEIPTLSKTTVYNSLNLFMDANLVKIALVEENEARYDIAFTDHGHFICESCDYIYDFPIYLEESQYPSLGNFLIKEKNVYFKGICSKCLSNK
ncbi:MAG TPA: transcriptional repressor [Clostridiaceae bacterium]|nr:transcriptional repressor [Clostridiaceae bacterium]